jgi:hypothetical protein
MQVCNITFQKKVSNVNSFKGSAHHAKTISASVSSEFREQHFCTTISNKKNGHLQGSTGTAMI